jgi:hypothetical protein
MPVVTDKKLTGVQQIAQECGGNRRLYRLFTFDLLQREHEAGRLVSSRLKVKTALQRYWDLVADGVIKGPGKPAKKDLGGDK